MNYNIAFIGKSISHSVLPQVYTMIGDQIDRRIHVESIEIDLASLKQTIQRTSTTDFHASCITFPYKTDAIKLVAKETLTSRAIKSGAINIIQYDNASSILSDNTDGQGFIYDVTINKKISFVNKNILMLGAGGAARGIIAALISEHPQAITICNRDMVKLQSLVSETNDTKLYFCDYLSIPKMEFDIVINATSASIQSELPPIPREIIGPNTICLECAYRFKKMTPFGELALKNGVLAYFDGIGMLVEQAAEAIKLLLNKSVETDFIIKKLSI